MSDLIQNLRDFQNMPAEADGSDPLIEVMNGLALEAADEIERLRQDCAEFYQIIGSLASAAMVFDEENVQHALDNASAAADDEPRRHGSLLPFVVRRTDMPGVTAKDVAKDLTVALTTMTNDDASQPGTDLRVRFLHRYAAICNALNWIYRFDTEASDA